MSSDSPVSFAADAGSTALPLLSNGKLSSMLDSHGAGFVRWRGLAVTRWREDAVTDPWGSFLLLRDEEDGAVWGATTQPLGETATNRAAGYDAGRLVFGQRHGDIESSLEIAVAPDADIELRRLTVTHHGDRTRHLSLTSYAELVLGPIGDDNAHPAFSKMFVQTEWDDERGLLLATRRRRSDSQAQVWASQALQVEGAAHITTTHETDRARFLGRCRTLRNAMAMQPGARLSGNTGCVLDPVFALRHGFTLAAGGSIRLLLWTQLADTRDGAADLRARLDDADAATQLFAAAARHAQEERQRFGIDATRARQFAQWRQALLVSDASQRAHVDQRERGQGGPPTLWGASISGDRPIALLFLRAPTDVPQLDELLLAQRWWQAHQLAMDVVVLDQLGADAGTQRDELSQRVDRQRQHLKEQDDAPKAELFCLRDDQIGDALRDGLLTVARLVLNNPVAASPSPPPETASRPSPIIASAAAIDFDDAAATPEFANGHGGFVANGRAYRIELDAARPTPTPWSNVIANPAFGFLVTAEGGGYAWSGNSQQNPLTPWPNDPVSDMPHEAIYLRDADDGALWTATALPIRVDGARCTTTHGKGWTRFRNDAHGIALELVQCVPVDDTIKLSRLRLCNRSARTRRLAITGYVEWALGPNGSTLAPFVVTSRDDDTGALFARNRWRADFGERVAFFDMGGMQQSISGDRAHFLGALGSIANPAALQDEASLDGHVGAGLDPCGALQTCIELPPGTSLELHFLLGEGGDAAAAQALVAKYRGIDIDEVLDEVAARWNGVLDTVQVSTPERSMDLLLNDWALYQVTACRLWARTAYYQASGAYGFRDQLQDVMALCVTRPDLAREHLLRAAGRQFAEGDVQHWWLPPKGQGIRTKIRDDRVWLGYVTMHYVEVSGDRAVLDEVLPFLSGQAIPDDATDAFFQPGVSDETATVYEHCARAIDTSLTRGAHGLPLIGTGDWNDGMNAVGAQGRGESSWLGWFLLATIAQLAPVAEQRGEHERARRWRDHAATLRQALEQAWDGAWYRRGYYDDGAPLGSAQDAQCQIDTIAQSWSVLAGADNHAHAAQAMASVDRLLVDHPHQLARLFTPPFDQDGKEDPGYIKGYPPGVRENGGQYTHGATWSVFAWAGLGDGDRAGDQFRLLNPINHGSSAEAIARYKVEPYVVCADVYSVTPHIGRGGWTWYTGSAAWLYRAGLEAVLGFHLRGDRLRIAPCIPKAWDGFRISYRHRGTIHEIEVRNPEHVCRGVLQVEMDGQTLDAAEPIALATDGTVHRLCITLGRVAA
ncbi:glycosyl transferase family 36 [Rhodanobacter sp. Root561]|uniref:GH36-type glycosyl hydrolase domain-containing protein n=1 Tax=Rhodanobacter sp. Root561 TaxID=1736560 RepID=UPI00070126ED|nr:glycosyl hydrolase family 65 protein [Rhodanobacter sp. Root561]KQZ79291.1 glycosyl transferase family 36 [Rhodanobacter sp. Root561]